MISANGSGVGLSDLSGAGYPPVARRLEMSSDSSGGMSDHTPVAAGSFLPAPVGRNKFRRRVAEVPPDTELIKVMNSLCTREQLLQSKEDFVNLAIKARDFETWMLPPEVVKDSLF